jgi:hypothetical protein
MNKKQRGRPRPSPGSCLHALPTKGARRLPGAFFIAGGVMVPVPVQTAPACVSVRPAVSKSTPGVALPLTSMFKIDAVTGDINTVAAAGGSAFPIGLWVLGGDVFIADTGGDRIYRLIAP